MMTVGRGVVLRGVALVLRGVALIYVYRAQVCVCVVYDVW